MLVFKSGYYPWAVYCEGPEIFNSHVTVQDGRFHGGSHLYCQCDQMQKLRRRLWQPFINTNERAIFYYRNLHNIHRNFVCFLRSICEHSQAEQQSCAFWNVFSFGFLFATGCIILDCMQVLWEVFLLSSINCQTSTCTFVTIKLWI